MGQQEDIKVWDIAVRVFHWSLAVLFFVAYVSGDEENLVHIYTGYAVLGLVGFRIVWGLIGPKHARFSDFVYGYKATAQYVKSLFSFHPIHYLGHNPLGGWMALALLLFLIGVCWSGLELYGAQGRGPLAGDGTSFITVAAANGDNEEHDDEAENESAGEGLWDEVHEFLSNVTLFLVFVHIVGVLIASAIHRENLIKAMLTGYKRVER